MNSLSAELGSKLQDYVLSEARRQSASVLSTADALQSKVGIYLVFAAFLFSAPVEMLRLGHIGRVAFSVPLLALSSVLVLIGILFLLRAVLVRAYSMPPLVRAFKDQTVEMAARRLENGIPESEVFEEIKGKLINSLSRSVANNFSQNQIIASNVSLATWILAGAILSLILAAAVPAAALVVVLVAG